MVAEDAKIILIIGVKLRNRNAVTPVFLFPVHWTMYTISAP